MNLFRKKNKIIPSNEQEDDIILSEEAIPPPPLPINLSFVLTEIKSEERFATIIQLSEYELDKCRELPQNQTNDLDMPLEITMSCSVDLDNNRTIDEDYRLYTSFVTTKSLALYTVLSLSLSTYNF